MKKSISQLRIELALLMDKKLPSKEIGFNPPHRFYWNKRFFDNTRRTPDDLALQIDVYFQRRIRGSRRMQPNYARIAFPQLNNQNAVRGDIETLLKSLSVS